MRRMSTARAGLLLVIAMAATTLVGATPASARKPDVPIVFGVPLDNYLSHFPDATRLPDGSYQLEPGRRLVPPMEPSDIGISEYPSGCDDLWFCLWEHSDFAGWSEWYYHCTSYNLYSFADLPSSMHNAQNGFTATFWDTSPSPDVQGKLRPNSYLRNLAWDLAPDGGNWNDRIDKVQAC